MQAVYAAAAHGLTIISPNRKLRTYNRRNGLRYDRCEALLKDNEGNVWVSNNKSLVKFNPSTQQFTHFEENSGLSIDGFRPNTALTASNGEMLWGSESDQLLFPEKLVITPSPSAG